MFNRIENMLNRTSDQDWSWWPMLALRPPHHVRMSRMLLCRMALFFGLLSGGVIVVLLLAYQVPITPLRILSSFVLGILGYTLIYGCSFCWAWNRRAKRLSASPE